MRRCVLGFLVGTLALYFINYVLIKSVHTFYFIEFTQAFRRCLDMAYTVVPGLIGGYIAKSRGAVVGLLVGFAGVFITLLDSYFFYSGFHGISVPQTIIVETIPQVIAGIAGACLAKFGRQAL